jgi:hypothetical protein
MDVVTQELRELTALSFAMGDVVLSWINITPLRDSLSTTKGSNEAETSPDGLDDSLYDALLPNPCNATVSPARRPSIRPCRTRLITVAVWDVGSWTRSAT